MNDHPLTLKKLDSGYWYARWSHEVWAQWRGPAPREEDFFHPSFSATPERIREAIEAVTKFNAEDRG